MSEPTLAELRAKVTEKGPWFAVPRGAIESECRSANCRAAIYWIATKNGKRMPVDVYVIGGKAPGDEDGRGVSHYATCPDAPKWRAKK